MAAMESHRPTMNRLLMVQCPIAGVDNSQPPNAINQALAANAENRLTESDGLNRPRPGLLRLQKPDVSLDSIHHLGVGFFLMQ